MADRRIVVWRHGRTAWNAERRFQGQLDVELDAVGLAQATVAATALASLAPSAIVSSDLLRARTTAQALAVRVDLPVRTDVRLREIDVGTWQGLTFDEVTALDPAGAAEWRDGGSGRRGGGETLVEVSQRATAAVREALADVDDGGVLVVATHGASGRAIVASMIGLPIDCWRALGSLANCCWSVVGESSGGGWRLFDHNAGSLPEAALGDDR